MLKDIRLYLDGKAVEWSEVPDILLTYQRTDYQNITVTKNMFSKTLTIDGTPNNNNIFNQIWSLERVMDDNFTLFNPSQKVSFELYNDSEIVEKGYAKLDSINKDGHKISYNITLYGGLGSFFYSLSYDINTDKEKTLADLNFMGSSTPDDEFDFEISKETVNEAWEALKKYGYNSGSTKKYDYFNFMVAYNGLPDEFDSNKFILNTHGSTGMSVRYTNNGVLQYSTFPMSVNNNGSGYSTYNGYVYGEMQRECTEWEMRDLRSYLQRPVLSVKGLIEAIKRPVNNGGYNVVLDSEFFSSGNPYYSQAFITLPMLNPDINAVDEYANWDWYISEQQIYTGDGPKELTWKIDSIDNIQGTPDVYTIEVEIHATITGATADKLYTSALNNNGYDPEYDPEPEDPNSNPPQLLYVGCTAVQMYGFGNGEAWQNASGKCGSPLIVLTSMINGSYFGTQSLNTWYGDRPYPQGGIQYNFGYWKKVSGSDYVWHNETDNTDFVKFTMDTNFMNEIPNIAISFSNIMMMNGALVSAKCGYAFDSQYYEYQHDMNNGSYKYWNTINFTHLNSYITYKKNENMRSFQTIKKKDLLGGMEGTPCDWLLSYCKLFGLFISKDKINNIIKIQLRKNWYKDEIVDLDGLVDRSNKIDVTPLTFESKWYNFKYNESDGKFLDRYKKEYSQDYGKQLIDTKYNFDADEIDLLEDNNFKNGLVCLEKSNYYNIKKDLKDFLIFPCLYNWCTMTYFNGAETYDIYMALPAGTSTTVFNSNTPDEFYDFLPKLQFHDEDNGGVDGEGVLVFFNGIKSTGDIDYWLTDDIDEMFDQSEKPCWIQTHHEWNDKWTEHIAIEKHTLPSFDRYVLHRNYITAALDFGYVKQLFVPYYRYDVNRTPTMYQNFWQSYISDLYSVNTRKIDCNVAINSNDVYDFMKKFYWFDNSYWVCTKVTDYNIAMEKSTLCSFTKVNDISAYFDTPTFNDKFFNFYRNDGNHNIPAQGTDEERSFTFNLDCSSNWVVTDNGTGFASFDPNYPTQGSYGMGYTIKAKYLPNYSQSPRYTLYIADNLEGEQRMIRVWQDGYVKEKYLKVEPTTVELPRVVDTPVSVTIDSSAEWTTDTIALWASLSVGYGDSGETVITVSATTNDTGDERRTQTTITNTDGLSQVLTIVQKGSAKVSLEQNEIFPVTTVPSSGGNVFYKLIADVETEVRPQGNTGNFAVASGLVTYNTTIQPTSGTNFWIHFDQNNTTVSRNASFYAYYEEDQGRYSIFPTIVPLPLQQSASGNNIVELNSYSHNESTELGANLPWTATTNTSWITLTTTTGSSSDGYIQYSVLANNSNYRTGYIYITYTDEMGYYCNEVIEVRQNAGVNRLAVEPTQIDCEYLGGSFIVSVTSATMFNVSIPQSWVSQTISRDGSFIIEVEPNNGFSRQCIVTVTSGGESETVTINQGSKLPEEYYLDYTPQDIVFESSGGTIGVTIRSNSNWEITE